MSNARGCNLWYWTILTGLLLLLEAGEEVTCLRGSAVILQAKAKAAELKEAALVEAAAVETDGNSTATNSTSGSTNSTQSKLKSFLTGIPQKDYIYDPNLPRELNGHNLTNYPFYNAIPEEIEFNCDGLHDGFYASVPHKCQVYHHCLFGTRYDFLCANYTAFDQKTFICHFVSEVDCENSPKYYKRNEALYKEATTAPSSTTTTAKPTTTASPPQPPPPPPPLPPRRSQGSQRNRHRRPYRRRRPVYEYYYDEDYDDSDYYEDDIVQAPRRKMNRKHRPQGSASRDGETDYEGQPQPTTADMVKPSVRPNSPSTGSVYDRPRIPPKIRRPVPINERDKYDYTQKTSDVSPPPTSETVKENRNQPRKQQTDDEEYYEDEYEEEQQPPKYKKTKQNDYDNGPTGSGDRRSSNRHRLRLQNRKRPDRYEDDDDLGDDDYEQEERPRSRKGQRYDDYNPRVSRPRGNRGKGYLRDDEAVPAERPGYISGSRTGTMSASNRKRPHNSEHTRNSGRKHQERRPVYEDEDDDDEYYYDDDEEVEEEKVSRRNHKPSTSRYNGRRDDEYTDDSRNGRRQNSKTSSLNSGNNSQKSLPSNRQSEKSRSEDGDYSKQLYKKNDKVNNDKTDSNIRQTASKNTDNSKISTKNYKTTNTDTQKPAPTDKYEDEEYEDDYEDTKPLNTGKSAEENVKEKSDNRQGAYSKSPNESTNERNNKQSDSANTGSSEDTPKITNNYRSTTVPSVQEQTNSYTRNPNLFRSRTTSPATSPTEETRPSSSVTPVTSYHRFSSTSSYGDEYQERDYQQNYRYKPENRSRTIPLTSPNNYKKQPATTPIPNDKSDIFLREEKPLKDQTFNGGDSSEKLVKDLNSDSVPVSGPSRPFVSVGLFRRPVKSTTTNIIETTTSVLDSTTVSSQKPLSAVGYRRIIKPNESDEKIQRKEPTGYSPGFRRPSKVIESDKTASSTTESTFDDEIPQRNFQQQTSGAGNSQYRKPVKPAETSTQENSYTYKNGEEDPRPTQQLPSAPGSSNYRRTSFNSRPVVEDYPAEYDDPPKVAQFPPSAPGSNYRRPHKTQKLQDGPSSVESSRTNYDTGSTAVASSGPGGGFRRPVEVAVKNEGSTIINLRSHYGFYNPNRPKQVENENLPTGPDSTAYPRLPTKNIIDKPESGAFPPQPPKNIDITAPGPSGPENLNQNTRNSFRPGDFSDQQNPSSGSNLDIADEEYDVTLNDALQPSTLHPTRSLAEYPQGRVKTRGFLSTVTHPSGFGSNRGGSPFLLSTSSSQQYISRVQSVQPQEKPSTVSKAEPQNQNKDSEASSADDEGYEAIVLSAPQYDNGNIQRWVGQRQSRPTEWYW
ncbi:uncharacterized protein LOC142323501 [Lycorma delicatula]|uniref:uncharacterized protein LOC142323501 n=1 Tax=Lycorma delicatula TaxID=130591 RepID=UPI003F5190F7